MVFGFCLMINSPKFSLKREDFMVKSENHFKYCISQKNKFVVLNISLNFRLQY